MIEQAPCSKFLLCILPGVASMRPAAFVSRIATYRGRRLVTRVLTCCAGLLSFVFAATCSAAPVFACPALHFVGVSGVSVIDPGSGSGNCAVAYPEGALTTSGAMSLSINIGKSAAMITVDQGGDVLWFTDAGGRITSLGPRPGPLISAVDSLGNSTQFVYDAFAHLVSATDALGHVTQFNYDANGRIVSSSSSGNVTSYSYSGARLVVASDAGGATTLTYDASGNVVSSTAAGNVTNFLYDASGKLLSLVDPLLQTTNYTYDAGGRLVSSNANGNLTSYQYDASGNLVRIIDPFGNLTRFSYDASGQLVTSTDSAGNTTAYLYDAQGNLVSSTDPLGDLTRLVYDGPGRVLNVIDAQNQRLSFLYASITIPEPGTLALLGFALAGLGLARRHKLH